MRSLYLCGSLRWSSAPAEQPELWESSIVTPKVSRAHSASLFTLFYLDTAIFSPLLFLLPSPSPVEAERVSSSEDAQLLLRVSPREPDSSAMAGERN